MIQATSLSKDSYEWTRVIREHNAEVYTGGPRRWVGDLGLNTGQDSEWVMLPTAAVFDTPNSKEGVWGQEKQL